MRGDTLRAAEEVAGPEMSGDTLRVTTIQYELRDGVKFDAFAARCESYVDEAKSNGSRWILFPELFVAELLGGPGGPRRVHDLSDDLRDCRRLFAGLATGYECNIVAGSWIVRSDGGYVHTSEVFLADGSTAAQSKLTLNPTERLRWGLTAGCELTPISAGGVRAVVLICSDIESSDLVRLAHAREVDVIFCPTSTATTHGYDRIRYCAHARAIESGCFVVTACTVGLLTGVDFMDRHYGAANVIAPSDASLGFGALLASGEPNRPMVLHASLAIDQLRRYRACEVVPCLGQGDGGGG